ncbi:MAG TPA: hypothetical protein DCX70_08275, partial [Chitinophagaceae bacterium]|nr:hypothetical protein [Chitinophagaceae bacterium]
TVVVPWDSETVFWPRVAEQPIRPAKERGIGRLLPHQLANRTRSHPWAINLWAYDIMRYSLLFFFKQKKA